MQTLKNNEHDRMTGLKVLVIGGGVGGIRAALDLAESRRNVILIDTSYSIGGLMTRLDRTFPTNNCDLCTISPHLSENSRQVYLDLMPMTRLEGLTGEAGQFKATLVTEPRYIDMIIVMATTIPVSPSVIFLSGQTILLNSIFTSSKNFLI